MDQSANRTNAGRHDSPAQAMITPTINHQIIRLLGSGNKLRLLDVSTAAALEINIAKHHLFSLMVAGMVQSSDRKDGTFYQLTESGKKLLKDITS